MPDKTNIYTALMAAQKEMGPVKKEAKGNYGKYARLDTVLEAIEDPLHNNGLTYTQRCTILEGQPVLVTEIIHAETGEKIDSMYPLVTKDPQDPQKLGGSMTYARRYSGCRWRNLMKLQLLKEVILQLLFFIACLVVAVATLVVMAYLLDLHIIMTLKIR